MTSMANSIDLCKIAKYCRDEQEQKCLQTKYKVNYSILYVAIYDNERIRVSQTPHILVNAQRCLLVHSWDEIAVTNGYAHYFIQSINSSGEVGGGNLDEDYSICISPEFSREPPRLYLDRKTFGIYSVNLGGHGMSYMDALSRELVKIWDLYKKCREKCKTPYEAQLLGSLAYKEGTIKDLEKKLESMSVKEAYLQRETGQYKSLLDEIKALLNNK
jgi:hypothetical protein